MPPEIAFTVRLTVDDWDDAMRGWRCPVLSIPGATVEAIYVDGARVDSARYEPLTATSFIRWITSEQPQRAAASIKLTEALSLGKETDRWKRLAIILPVAATILAATITGIATYLARSTDQHRSSELPERSKAPASKSMSPPANMAQQEAKKSPPAKTTPAGANDEAITDVITAENNQFASALPVELGRTYLSRFRLDDSPIYFSFRQSQNVHDLLVELTIVDADLGIRPLIAIYTGDHTKLVTRWPEKTDAAIVRWSAPVLPGSYTIEINPYVPIASFQKFRLKLIPN